MFPYSPLLSNQFMLLIPILSLFQAFQLKTSHFFGIIRWRIFTSAVNTRKETE